ncbi:MAG TPA: membrane or secreted protein, partial [Bacteroides sp.]|nr:membrane or secreted protein [Bacteroides sp.]
MLGFKKLFICLILGLGIACGITGQPSTYVDEQGVMRWTENDEEVTAFGVNYGTPFAHPFRAHNYMGVPHEMAIDADVYHFARMGLDGYRIHVWDTEISDSAGNLLFNKHLQLFDYLLFRLKERQIKMFITPMNFYTNGYPESGTPTPGFQNYFEGKRGCLTDTASFPVQENYLSQFVSHVNPYTGIAYKDEPYIVAVEINNEPFNHGDRPDLTTEYIDRMAAAIRSTGFEKPIFYNVSHNINQIDNFCAAQIQGGTFQWYPTGLVSGHDIKGNMLPNVDEYLIPFDNHPRFKNMARAVYEFSPADVGASGHIYPVMARSFREKGFQIAAQFAYDPAAMGHANTDYQTHYLSLPFAPKKAMGMMIASEVFHRIPLRKSFGRYPDNVEFDVFRISYEEDLAEMVTDEKFLHSNSTTTSPPDPLRLEQVAGTGRSPVVEYEGTGVYFLDKLEPGVWRLEVMPDAIWVKDPFARPSLDRKASVVIWKTWPMTIKLPDLGDDFSIKGLNEGNNILMTASGKTLPVSPGTYLLTRKGTTSNWGGDDHWHNIILKEFYA